MRISLLVPALALVCMLVVVGGFSAAGSAPAEAQPQATAPPQLQPQSGALAEMERQLFAQINAARRSQGRAPLRWEPQLARVARSYSRRRSEEGFTGHVDPAGRGLEQRLQQAGLDYRLAAENLARNYNMAQPAQVALDGWLASEEHRENLLGAAYRETGIGIWRDGDTYHFTQVFRTPPS